MTRIFNVLAQTHVLWATFIATITLTICFGIVMHIWDFVIIDEMYQADKIIRHIDAMSPRQRSVHAWMTGTLDVLYPFAYGSFLWVWRGGTTANLVFFWLCQAFLLFR